MKVIIFALLVTFVTCLPYDSSTGTHQHGSHQHGTHQHGHHNHTDGHDSDSDHDLQALPLSKVYGKAKKVPGTSSAFGLGGDTCPTVCLTSMNSKISQDAEMKEFTTKQSQPYRFDGQFDKEKLTKYCKVMNQTKDCVEKCGESQMKGIADRAMLAPKYTCIDTKYLDYTPCYAKVTKINEKICHADNKCGGKKAALQSTMSRRPSSMDDIEKLLKKTCEYFVCYNNCDRPQMTEQCGADAARVLEGMYKNNLNVMTGLFQQMGLQIPIPAVCNQVGAHDE